MKLLPLASIVLSSTLLLSACGGGQDEPDEVAVPESTPSAPVEPSPTSPETPTESASPSATPSSSATPSPTPTPTEAPLPSNLKPVKTQFAAFAVPKVWNDVTEDAKAINAAAVNAYGEKEKQGQFTTNVNYLRAKLPSKLNGEALMSQFRRELESVGAKVESLQFESIGDRKALTALSTIEQPGLKLFIRQVQISHKGYSNVFTLTGDNRAEIAKLYADFKPHIELY